MDHHRHLFVFGLFKQAIEILLSNVKNTHLGNTITNEVKTIRPKMFIDGYPVLLNK